MVLEDGAREVAGAIEIAHWAVWSSRKVWPVPAVDPSTDQLVARFDVTAAAVFHVVTRVVAAVCRVAHVVVLAAMTGAAAFHVVSLVAAMA